MSIVILYPDKILNLNFKEFLIYFVVKLRILESKDYVLITLKKKMMKICEFLKQVILNGKKTAHLLD
jgi:hypothetical protein